MSAEEGKGDSPVLQVAGLQRVQLLSSQRLRCALCNMAPHGPELCSLCHHLAAPSEMTPKAHCCLPSAGRQVRPPVRVYLHSGELVMQVTGELVMQVTCCPEHFYEILMLAS